MKTRSNRSETAGMEASDIAAPSIRLLDDQDLAHVTAGAKLGRGEDWPPPPGLK